MQYQYWVTKKAVSRRFGAKEDECVISSDAELDSKLELFKSISDNCVKLQRLVNLYQDKFACLADEEVHLGRYLKECAKNDKNSSASQMLAATGRALSGGGNQRGNIHPILLRFYNELETFIEQAVFDTKLTLNQMEEKRTEYRATLSWMKSASAELNPESNAGVRQFRRIQSHVKDHKTGFDRTALNSLQKIDLLAAARCNMFSHSLASYQQVVHGFYTKMTDILEQTVDILEQIDKRVTQDLSNQVAAFIKTEGSDGMHSTGNATPIKNSDESNGTDTNLLGDNFELPSESSTTLSMEQMVSSSNSELLQMLSWPIGDLMNTGNFMPSNLLQDFWDNSSHPMLPNLTLDCLSSSNNTSQQSSTTVPKDETEKTSWCDIFTDLDPLLDNINCLNSSSTVDKA